MKYDIFKPWLTLDPWQKGYIAERRNCHLLCGRQSGKTAAMSIKFGTIAAENPKEIIMMIALTEKQAYALFFKTLMFLEAKFPKMIKTGHLKPTKHIINLTNGSIIMCYAAGLTGAGLRTYTLTRLVIDEAAPMSREIFIATMPMLSVTGGIVDMSSTPRGKAGYYYDCSKSEDFVKFKVSAEDCPRHNKQFLEAEKLRMSKLEYAQEYLAEFLDELKRVFSDDWIKGVCKLKRTGGISKTAKYSMGCDIARMGEDEGTYEILDYTNIENITQVESIITTKQLTTETEKKIIELTLQYNFRNIYIDAGAGTLGVSVFDHLLNHEKTKNKVVAINSRARPYDRDDQHKARLLQEDLYNNLVGLGERGEIQLLDDDEVIASLKSVQYEYVIKANQQTKLRIFGSYTHVAEGLIRAAWCSKDKHLKLWVGYKNHGISGDNLK